MTKLRKMLTHRGKNESGQGALAMVLILLMLGAIILTPLLVFMSTGLKAGQVYESKMQEFYAADAGIEDGLWQIEYGHLDEKFTSPLDYDLYDYYTNYNYTLVDEVNDRDVYINITNVWIPDMDTPSTEAAKQIIEQGKLIITGSSAESTYQIKINYDYGDEGTDALKVKEIGIWLPPGFHYVEGSCSLNGQDYYSEPSPAPYKSGEAVVWNFASVPLVAFPGGAGSPMVKSFTFNFSSPSELDLPGAAISWIDTTGVDDLVPGFSDITYTWDADVKPYKIESTAGSVTTEAYTAEIGVRKPGAAISGDYVAIGNSLMMPDPNNNPYDPNQDYRSRLLEESSATITTVTDIPADATVEAAYLYWSGWIDHFYWYKQHRSWRWSSYPLDWSVPQDNWTGLVYPTNPTPDNLKQMVETNAKVNTVNFGGGGVMQDITATQWQVWPKTNDAPACWYYTCFYDATDLVNQLIADGDIEPNGGGTYTLGHASSVVKQVRTGDSDSHTYRFDFDDSSSDYTGYPLGTPAHKLPGEWGSYHGRYHASYAGWSLVIIYSSPETKGHQLYLYDIANPGFMFKESYPEGASESNPDFDGDGNPGGRISGFLVPEKIEGETNAARMTCFVGEGDNGKTGDSFKVTGPSSTGAYLLDGTTGTVWNDVWNSRSVGVTASGIDIDTFYVTWSSGILEAGDTWAQVDIPTVGDGFTLSYIILSFRSAIHTGGTISYLIRG